MSAYILDWVEVPIEQYQAIPLEQQILIDTRISQLLNRPDGPGCSYDGQSDQWTTSDQAGAGLVTYVFRLARPRLVILRLIY